MTILYSGNLYIIRLYVKFMLYLGFSFVLSVGGGLKGADFQVPPDPHGTPSFFCQDQKPGHQKQTAAASPEKTIFSLNFNLAKRTKDHPTARKPLFYKALQGFF